MKRVNKFYLLMSVLILFLGLITIYSIRAVINSFMTSSQVERGEKLVTVDSVKLEEVYEWAFERENISLLIAEDEPQIISEVENEEVEE